MGSGIQSDESRQAGLITTVLASAMAGAMAWGIRGQYGHETGAMIAGVLVGFVVVLLQGQHLPTLGAARAIAMLALGISIGGSMTYGQTVGLTHDRPLVGNSAALGWGLLGLAIKGGIWIGLGGACLGMGLSGKRYRPIELVGLFAMMLLALFVGIQVLNRPFDIAARQLPAIYFSDDWYWEPDVDKPRLERWGGLAFALSVLLIYLGGIKRDRLGLYLGSWGLLAGALGFPLGQSVQAFHAWNTTWIAETAQSITLRESPDLITLQDVVRHINWWNMMETTFGGVFGAVLGCGVWAHRRLIGQESPGHGNDTVTLSTRFEWLLASLHLGILFTWNFLSVDAVDLIADQAIPMIIVPTIAVLAGRFWPFLVALPFVLVPIAGKTLRQLSISEQTTSLEFGWVVYVALPLALFTWMACFFAKRSVPPEPPVSRWFPAAGLVVATWIYFSLNFAFFHLPWPWLPWTGRTPNGMIFFACAVGLTISAFFFAPQPPSRTVARSP